MVYLVDFEEAVLFCYRFLQFRLTVRTTDQTVLLRQYLQTHMHSDSSFSIQLPQRGKVTLPTQWSESTNFVAVFLTVAPVVLKAVWTKPPSVAHLHTK